MAGTTTRVSGAVSRMLEAGQISRVDEATGVLQSLHANCPDDGNRASVRRMTRELGGPVMEVIMRCPACFRDFVAGPTALYLYPRTVTTAGGVAKRAPAAKAAKGSAKVAKTGAAKGSTKSAKAAKTATAAKAASKAARPARKGAVKSAKKAGVGRASTSAKKTQARR